MNNQIMCFCTCSINDKEHYLQNIKKWKNQILENFENVDLKVFSDGIIEQKIDGVEIISLQPTLGRKTSGCFPGWKRSFREACKYFLNSNYKYLWHIENDILINKEKHDSVNNIKSYLMKQGLYTSHAQPYGFLQTAFMILNDKKFLEEMVEFYEDENNLNENIMFENSKMSKYQCEIPFKSIRFDSPRLREKAKHNTKQYDYFAQYKYNGKYIS